MRFPNGVFCAPTIGREEVSGELLPLHLDTMQRAVIKKNLNATRVFSQMG